MNKTFTSQDISLVAFLYTKGNKILNITRRDNFNRKSFVFQETKPLLDHLYDYQRNQAIPVQDYYRSLSHIWGLIKQTGGKNEKSSL